MLSRWLTYQQERFSLVKTGLLVAVFSFAAIGYSFMLQGGTAERSVLQFLGLGFIAFINVALFFLQLQVVDDLKDFKEDAIYRPHYPLPRGAISLEELKVFLIASGLVQLGLALSVGWPLVAMLGVIWGYITLLVKDFFIFQGITNRPLVYLFCQAAIVPLVAVYTSLLAWIKTGSGCGQLGGFLAVSFFVGVVIQLRQKIRSPKEEKSETRPDSALWGTKRAVLIWLSVIWSMAIAALIAAAQIQFMVPIALTLLFLLTASVLTAWRFLVRPISKWANGLALISELWIFLVYFHLGIVPVLF